MRTSAQHRPKLQDQVPGTVDRMRLVLRKLVLRILVAEGSQAVGSQREGDIQPEDKLEVGIQLIEDIQMVGRRILGVGGSQQEGGIREGVNRNMPFYLREIQESDRKNKNNKKISNIHK